MCVCVCERKRERERERERDSKQVRANNFQGLCKTTKQGRKKKTKRRRGKEEKLTANQSGFYTLKVSFQREGRKHKTSIGNPDAH